MPGRREKADRPVTEEIHVALDGSPVKSGLVEVLTDISMGVGRLGEASSIELLSLHDDRRVGKVPESARVVDVKVGLNEVRNGLRRDAELAKLGDAVLPLGHPDTELVSERTPVSASIAGDSERIATVHDDVARWVTDQEERHRHLDPADLKGAASEQVEHETRRHAQIVRTARNACFVNSRHGCPVVQRLS